MNNNCQTIVFSNKAYNAIIDETFKKEPVETGGILLGHILDNGIWVVMEVLPPGINSIHQIAYFEYDDAFVNYLAKSVATKYQIELNLLGLWHRHPGSMDVFSGTDDRTNLTFANLNPKGAISGLVNVDPKFRLTMRHVSSPLQYEIVEYEVGDDLIPSEYFQLKHFPEKGLHPFPVDSKKASETVIERKSEILSLKNYKKGLSHIYNNLKSHIILPICILSFILIVLLALSSPKHKTDNDRHVSTIYVTQIEKQLDTVALKEAVATFTGLSNDSINNDSVAFEKACKAYNSRCCKSKPIIKTKEVRDENTSQQHGTTNNKKLLLLIMVLIFLLSLSVFLYEPIVSCLDKLILLWDKKDYDYLFTDEHDLKNISQTCEKNIENNIVSFLIVTDKKCENFEDALAYQIVYPQDFKKEGLLRIYLITPSFEEIAKDNNELDSSILKKDNQGEQYFEADVKFNDGHGALKAVNCLYTWLGLNK